MSVFFFFFQAEDGIRDHCVTGVQTCALPIYDVAAFVDAVAEPLGPVGRWFHYGLTSSDVLDTALSLQIREAGALILEGIERTLAAVLEQAERHRRTLMMGRTHGVHAEPTTFGLKLAGWAWELEI